MITVTVSAFSVTVKVDDVLVYFSQLFFGY